MDKLNLIRAKDGVNVYRGLHNGWPAIAKYFEREADRREILNYQILARHEIPTLAVFAVSESSLVLEDINHSGTWRLGVEEDFYDVDVARALAGWYFALHEKGSAAPELADLYFEYDSITVENLEKLTKKLPEGAKVLRLLLSHFGQLQKLIETPPFVLTYNDFHWTNLAVCKDKKAAMMFDYNMMGRGYRCSDLRNVCSLLSAKTGGVFMEEYGRLLAEKHDCCLKGLTKVEERGLMRYYRRFLR